MPEHSTRWPDEDGPFEVTLRFAPREGHMQCIGIDVQADAGTIVNAAALRDLRLGELVDDARKALFENAQFPEEDFAQQRELWNSRHRGGRPAEYDFDHWTRVALAYRDAYEQNRTPTRAVERQWKVSYPTAAKWVAKCRKLGLLPPTTRGKPRSIVTGEAHLTATLRGTVSGEVSKPATKKKGKRK